MNRKLLPTAPTRERNITKITEVNISDSKPVKNNIKAEIKFESDEMKLLQENYLASS